MSNYDNHGFAVIHPPAVDAPGINSNSGHNNRHKNSGSGFTLIECLVALLILAIVLASASKAIGSAILDVQDSYTREVANWVADNEYNGYYLEGTFPDLGNSTKQVTMAGIDFVEQITVAATQNQYFRQITIAVSEKSHPNYVLFKTVNFIAQY
ncbi:MAG: ral secretion pathway protein [Pseudomonadota bacterium]|nr:ral secretion pathway protein [Pseudomonadota bacterium]